MKKEALEKVLRLNLNTKTYEVLTFIHKNPGLNVSELGEKFGIKQSTMSHRLKLFEDAEVVKIEYDSKGGGVSKRYYPSIVGGTKYMFKEAEIKLSKTETKAMERLWSNQELIKIVFKSTDKLKKLKKSLQYPGYMLSLGENMEKLEKIIKSEDLEREWGIFVELMEKMQKKLFEKMGLIKS